VFQRPALHVSVASSALMIVAVIVVHVVRAVMTLRAM
jgi:hypothetical protein